MAVLVQNTNGHIQHHLTRSLEKILDEANQSGELKLSNRKLKDFPKCNDKYSLGDTVIADLSKNRFSELPDEVTAFNFLEELHCYHNSIRYIPDTIINLQCLLYLDLSRNQLTSLPREVCQLPIKILLVSNNNLSYLPDELNRMSHLTELDASCNQLTHLPPRMGDLKNLQSLILRNNLLLAVPIELTYLKLAKLDLRANRISTLPIEMRNMDNLIELHVEDNPLTGPPASLCRRGRVHIFKYLEDEAIRLDRKLMGNGNVGGGTLSRKSRKNGSNGATAAPPLLSDRLLLKQKRQNVDSGYSTSSDCFEKRWSQEINTSDLQTSWKTDLNSIMSTPSTASPGPPELFNEEDLDGPVQNGSGDNDAKTSPKPLHQIQTYREYKEALKQQRAHDVPSIYRTKDTDDTGTTYKTEPNTPTHHRTSNSPSNHTALATSKSDPTPLNAVLNTPKYEPISKISPYKSPQHHNGNTVKYIQDYVKPKSPVKASKIGILSHDHVPGVVNMPPTKTAYANGGTGEKNGGCKLARTISWKKDVPPDKMTFTMRREIDKAREESDLINHLRNIIENRLKMVLPEDLAPALTDGVVLCHLANHIKPRSVASIHVPSPAVPKLTMARCRRNVDNFIEACRKIGVDEGLLCSSLDVTEALSGRGLPRLVNTVCALCEFAPDSNEKAATSTAEPLLPQSRLQDTTVSLLLLTLFLSTVAFFVIFPPPD